MTGRINTFRTAIAETIKAAMPALKECEPQLGRFDLDELERGSIKTPAIRVGVLMGRLESRSNDTSSALFDCAAFAITDGKGRDAAAWNMAEAVAELLRRNQRWGLQDIGVPESLRIGAIVTGQFKSRGISVVAVDWKQKLNKIGAGIVFDDEGVVYEELYINGELAVDDTQEAPT